MLEFIKAADCWLLLVINGLHNPLLDKLMVLFSGSIIWMPLYIWVLWLWVKRFKYYFWYPVLITIVLLLITDQVSAHIFKPLFHRFRPCWNSEITDKLYLLDNICGGKYGFISSHAANTAGFMIFSVISLRSEMLKWCLLFMTVIVGYSRIYLGVHYPLDVMFGWMVGIILGQLLYYVYVKLPFTQKMYSK